MEAINKNQIPVVILCGGRGTRLKEETEVIPKPLVKIGDKPILWHIMKIFKTYGFTNFILPVGYKGEKIKEYFANYSVLQNDFTIQLGDFSKKEINLHNPNVDDWQVTIVDTGLETMTGARLQKVEKFINNDLFLLTYGDGVSNVNLDKLLNYHLEKGTIATVTGVRPPARFGELSIEDGNVVSFREKPQTASGYINGGFFVMKKDILKLLPEKDDLSLEGDVLPQIAEKKELAVFCHDDYWQCMDTLRDVEFLNEEWQKGKALWKIWP